MNSRCLSNERSNQSSASSCKSAHAGLARVGVEGNYKTAQASTRTAWKRADPRLIIALILLPILLVSLLSPGPILADNSQASQQIQEPEPPPDSTFTLPLRALGAVAMAVCFVLAGIALVALALVLHRRNRRKKPTPASAPGARARQLARRPTVVSPATWGKLTVAGGPAQARELDLIHPTLTIGRSASNDLMLPDNRVSRQHALIEQRAGGAMVTDLGSSNGTFINGRLVRSSHPLQAGARVRIGNTELVFHPTGGSHVPAPAQRSPVQTRGRPRQLSVEGDGAVLTIGRGLDCDVVLADRYVSRHHARISNLPMVTLVQDLGSTHGTYVNGVRIGQPTPLKPGDVIRIGNSELII